MTVSFEVTNNGGNVPDAFDVSCVMSASDDWDVKPEEHIAL